jgi:DNA-binding NarL/FixJ family response regulator
MRVEVIDGSGGSVVDHVEALAGGRQQREPQRLSISEDTVKRHMKSIMQKLGGHDRTKAIAIAARRGIIQS